MATLDSDSDSAYIELSIMDNRYEKYYPAGSRFSLIHKNINVIGCDAWFLKPICGDNIYVVDLNHFNENFRKIRTLTATISDLYVSDCDLSKFPTSIKELTIRNMPHATRIIGFEHMKNITHISIYDCPKLTHYHDLSMDGKLIKVTHKEEE